jgi:hypothetical protein
MADNSQTETTPPGAVQPDGSASVYPRDHSFYMHSHGGSASKFHFLGKDLASKCGKARMLDTDARHDAARCPTVLRCKANGCKELWPNARGELPPPSERKT